MTGLPPAPPIVAVPADDEPAELALPAAAELPAVVLLVPALALAVPAELSAAPRGPSCPPLQPSASPKTNPRPRAKLVAVDIMRIHQW